METTVIFDKKGPSKILKQPLGGGRIELYGAADQSAENCGKHVVGGGFNLNSPEELFEILGEKPK